MNFNQIYKKHYKDVLFFVNGKVNDMPVSEEITQDTFMSVNKHLHEFDPEKGKLRTWLYFIANNKTTDYFRSTNHNNNLNTKSLDYSHTDNNNEQIAEIEYVTSGNTTDGNYDRNLLNVNIQKAFANLKGKNKQVAELFFLHEKQYNEIAEILDMPMNSVKVTLLRAKEKLQSYLQMDYATL